MATKKTNSEFLAALLYLVIGVVLIIFRSATLSWLMTAAGIFFIVSGVLEIIRKNTMNGAVSLIIGIAVLVLGWIMVEIVLLVLGVLIAIKGIIALYEALKVKKPRLLAILFAILTVVAGLLLAFGDGIDYMILIVGILLAVDGVLGLISCLRK